MFKKNKIIKALYTLLVSSFINASQEQSLYYTYTVHFYRTLASLSQTVFSYYPWQQARITGANTNTQNNNQLDWQAWIAQCEKMPFFYTLNKKFPITELGDENCRRENMQKHCNAIQEKTALKWDFVTKIIGMYKQTCDQSSLFNVNAWVEKEVPLETFTNREKTQFKPFILGFKVPKNATIYAFGDRHGDALSTIQMLKKLRDDGIFDKDFTLNNTHTYIVGLGDYVDRGTAGIETLLTILMLKIQNPKNVLLIRGNHEDNTLIVNQHHFQKELEYKFPDAIRKEFIGTSTIKKLTPISEKNLNSLACIYDTMPVAAFIGVDNQDKTTTSYLVYAHGCMDIRDNPKKLFLELNAKTPGEFVYKQYPIDVTRAQSENANALKALSSLQNDCSQDYLQSTCRSDKHLSIDYEQAYIDNDNNQTVAYIHDQQCVYGKPLVQALFKDWRLIIEPSNTLINTLFGGRSKNHTSYVHATLRGHQHSCHDYEKFGSCMEEMWKYKGCAQAWNPNQRLKENDTMPRGSFYTILAAPNNEYGEPISRNNYPGYTYDTWVNIKPTELINVISWQMTRINLNTIKKD